MIIKNEIPILEFDTDASDVIMPTHEHLDLNLPKKAVFAFLGEHIDEYAKTHDAVQVGKFLSATKDYPIYVVKHKGENVCLCQAPVGSAPAAQLMDWLIGYGVEEIITGGCCGALTAFEENVFLVPYKALRDEGTSYHYMKPSRFVDINPTAMKAIERTVAEHELEYREVITWTTDGFYRETKEKVEYRKSEGCETVEMECSALCAVAKMREATFGMLLYSADTLAVLDRYLERDWGRNSKEKALAICFEALSLL